MQRLPAITHERFGLIRFRSHLLTESQLFSLPVGTEIFHFPTFPPTALYIQAEVARHNSGFLRGFPIRTSPDHSSFTNSPGLIAGYNVLHRLLVPRHPPIALSSLPTTKMLTSTVQFSKHKQETHPTTPPPGNAAGMSPPQGPTPKGRSLKTQQCTKNQTTTHRMTAPHPKPGIRMPSSTQETSPNPTHLMCMEHSDQQWLLRKEVIQPHLPVRLPCYDLVLITDPTFDSSPQKGWATGFGCYRLS